MIKFKHSFKTNSQAGQDLFVCNITSNKENGYYVEVGSAYPKNGSNTYLLEETLNWKGISLEINNSFVSLFRESRINPCLEVDATIFGFKEYFVENNFPKQIDYLQIDIHPPFANLCVLENLPLDLYRFSTITFEHDLYAKPENKIVKQKAEEILFKYGYKRIVNNLRIVSPSKGSSDKWEPFEDWWVDTSVYPQFNFQDTIDDPRWVDLFNFNQKFKFCVYLGVLKIRLKKSEDKPILSFFIKCYRHIVRIIRLKN